MATASAGAPFLDVQSFVQDEVAPTPPVRPNLPSWSPFLSVYESSDGESSDDTSLREAYSSIVGELYDEEFDESLFELLTGARNLHRDQVTAGRGVDEADRIVTQHFAQLIHESESMVDAVAREFGARESGIVEQEIDSFVEGYVPGTPLEPAFEEFLGKLVKKIGRGVRKVAGTALKVAKDSGAGPDPQPDQGTDPAAVEQGDAKGDRQASGGCSSGGTDARPAPWTGDAAATGRPRG